MFVKGKWSGMNGFVRSHLLIAPLRPKVFYFSSRKYPSHNNKEIKIIIIIIDFLFTILLAIVYPIHLKFTRNYLPSYLTLPYLTLLYFTLPYFNILIQGKDI